jgi:hypothetical protein
MTRKVKHTLSDLKQMTENRTKRELVRRKYQARASAEDGDKLGPAECCDSQNTSDLLVMSIKFLCQVN